MKLNSFMRFANENDRPSYVVFNLEVSDDEVLERSLARSRDVVDTPKSVAKRLEEYIL
ncbi:MAG: hypothetical protein R3B53_03620 [Candidatus Paceibacterota bacterium]